MRGPLLDAQPRVRDVLARTSDAALIVVTHDPARWDRCDRVVELRTTPALVG